MSLNDYCVWEARKKMLRVVQMVGCFQQPAFPSQSFSPFLPLQKLKLQKEIVVSCRLILLIETVAVIGHEAVTLGHGAHEGVLEQHDLFIGSHRIHWVDGRKFR